MPHLVEVAFKGNRKEFFLWEQDDAPPSKAALIVEADRGEDLGRVFAIGDAAEHRSAGAPHGLHGEAPSRKALRLATSQDLAREQELRALDEEARRKAMERVKANGLVMKVSDAEWQWDRRKLTFFFTAEKRVDFRTLVRELAAMFRTRIELKQIGVRDEAKRLDGIGRCGRQYCSAAWLPELRPVNLGVAKDQRLSLNPSQISGACGRLMCCLRYEHEFYVQSRKRFPKEGKVLVTTRGEEKVVANDIFNERVTLRNVEGDLRVVPLAELRREMASPGAELVTEDVGAETEGVDASMSEEMAVDEAPRETRRRDRPARDTTPIVSAAQPVRPPEIPAAPAAAEARPETETEAEERRARRRRGRRGGRRGRERNRERDAAAGGAPEAPDATASPAQPTSPPPAPEHE